MTMAKVKPVHVAMVALLLVGAVAQTIAWVWTLDAGILVSYIGIALVFVASLVWLKREPC